jgi:hypothetical protein
VSSGSCTFVVGEGDGVAGQPDRGWPARRWPQVLHVGDLRGVSLEAIEVGLGDSAFPEGIEREERRDGVICVVVRFDARRTVAPAGYTNKSMTWQRKVVTRYKYKRPL